MFDLVGDLRKIRFEYGRRFQPPADITCETKNGLMTFSNKDRCIGRRLFARRHWSWDMIQRCRKLLIDERLILPTGNDLLINVGANIGCILIPLMREGLFQRGIGFEPAPANAAYLRANVEQNGLAGSVQTFELGLSDASRVAPFEMSPRNSGDHRVRSDSAARQQKSAYDEEARQVIQIQLARLDDMVQDHDIELGRNSLMWVDIQGHEGQFFEGARRAIARGIPVVTELWPYGINRSGIEASQFCELINDLFGCFYVFKRKRWCKHDVTAFPEVYDRYASGTSGTDIVLVPNEPSEAPN